MATPAALHGGQDSTLVNVQATAIVRVLGLTIRETAGAAAVMRLRAGSNTGPIIASVYLAANTSQDFDWGIGRVCHGDLIEDWVSGAYEGSAFYA